MRCRTGGKTPPPSRPGARGPGHGLQNKFKMRSNHEGQKYVGPLQNNQTFWFKVPSSPCLKMKHVSKDVPADDRLHMWFDQSRWIEYMWEGFDIPEVPALRMWEFIRKCKGTKKGRVREHGNRKTIMKLPAFIIIKKVPKETLCIKSPE